MHGSIIHLRSKISFVAMVSSPIRGQPLLTLLQGAVLNIFRCICQTMTLLNRPFRSSSLTFVASGSHFILNTCCTTKCTRLVSLSHLKRHTACLSTQGTLFESWQGCVLKIRNLMRAPRAAAHVFRESRWILYMYMLSAYYTVLLYFWSKGESSGWEDDDDE